MGSNEGPFITVGRGGGKKGGKGGGAHKNQDSLYNIPGAFGLLPGDRARQV